MSGEANCVEFDLDHPPGRLVTITGPLSGEGRCARRSEDRGQYGHLVIELAPYDGPSAYCFEWRLIPPDVLPPFARPGALAGFRAALADPLEGPLYVRERAERDAKLVLTRPEHEDRYLVLVRLTVVNGSVHAIDSDEEAFTIAAQRALHHALRHADLIEV
jgi:hypothetical protein